MSGAGWWSAFGAEDGDCGHRHKTESAARACVERKDREVRRLSSCGRQWSDRVAVFNMPPTPHTPGPWAVGYGAAYRAAPGGGIDDESPRLLLADRSTPATTPTERDANIRRAVECVNALAGVEDPAATLASIAGFLEDVARGCDPDEARTIAADLLALLGGAL